MNKMKFLKKEEEEEKKYIKNGPIKEIDLPSLKKSQESMKPMIFKMI
jgi:hypothetical protein